MTLSCSKKCDATAEETDLTKSSKPIYIGDSKTKCQHSPQSK